MLTKLWRAVTGAAPEAMPPRHRVHYVTFAIDDPVLAQSVRDWRAKRDEAKKAISAYIKDLHAPTLFGPWTTVRYHIDEKTGSLSKIAYSGYVPEGWEAEPNSVDHWLVPKHTARRDLSRLPPMPSMAALAALIDWPVLPVAGTRAEREFAQQFNYLPVVHEKNGRLFIDLPHPANFPARPDVAALVDRWDGEPRLNPVATRRGARDPWVFI